jgi:hypothetical protein
MELMFDVEEEPRVELLEEKTVFPVKVKRVEAGEQDYIGMVCVAIPKAEPEHFQHYSNKWCLQQPQQPCKGKDFLPTFAT